MKREKEELTTRYLLGELPELEQDEFEKKYLADDAAYEELLLAEDQLIDAFVRNELSAEEREQFEQHFMVSPVRRERVDFARALMSPEIDPLLIPSEVQLQASGQRQGGKPAFFGWAQRLPVSAWVGAAVMGVLILVCSWFFLENRRLTRELVRAQSERPVIEKKEQTAGITPQDERVSTNRATAPVTGSLSLQLAPGLARDPGLLPIVRLARGISFLSVQLELERIASKITYRATVETAEGKEIWNRSGLLRQERNRDSGFILIEIPAARLRPGDYVVMLRADKTLTEIGDYHFTVLR